MTGLRRHLGADHPEMAQVLDNYGRLKRDQKDYAAAEKALRESVDIDVRKLGAEHPSTASHGLDLGHVLALEGRFQEAEPLLVKGLAAAEARSDSRNSRRAAEQLVKVCAATGRPAEAETYRLKLQALPEGK